MAEQFRDDSQIHSCLHKSTGKGVPVAMPRVVFKLWPWPSLALFPWKWLNAFSPRFGIGPA